MFGILLPSIEIVHEPSEPRDLCDCLRESASYILLRVHKKKLYIPSSTAHHRDSGWGNRMEKLGTIEMLIRFARFLGCLVLFCECRSSADGVAVECVPRSEISEGVRARKNKDTEDYERISFTISKGSNIKASNVILLYCCSVSFIHQTCISRKIFMRFDYWRNSIIHRNTIFVSLIAVMFDYRLNSW